jgi:hypothetical protein
MLLFTWMIAHADNTGRLRGEPSFMKAVVVPYVPGVTEADVEIWLAKLASLGLIDWYVIKGNRYVHLRGWANHQRLNRMKHSDLPDPPAGDHRSPLASTDRQAVADGCLKGSEGEVGVEVEGEVEEEGREKKEAEGERGRRPRTLLGQSAPSPEKRHAPNCICEECFKAPTSLRLAKQAPHA